LIGIKIRDQEEAPPIEVVDKKRARAAAILTNVCKDYITYYKQKLEDLK